MADEPELVGVLVVRAWVGDGAAPRFRARVTRTLDVHGGETVATTIGNRKEVVEAVERWLDGLATASENLGR